MDRTISKEMTVGRHSKGPEYCLLPEERNRFRENPQHILVFCTFGGGLTEGVPARHDPLFVLLNATATNSDFSHSDTRFEAGL